jgi:hypothetical protein
VEYRSAAFATEEANMDADLQFKVAGIGLGVLSTVLTTLVVFTH